jgi:molybdate transport system ATP-binding protein
MAAESETAIVYVSHRQEEGLKSHKLFELIPSRNGSNGKIR